MRKQLFEENQKLANRKFIKYSTSYYDNKNGFLILDWDPTQNRIKIKWNASKDDLTNGGYNSENLRKFLQKYGEINALVISNKKNGSALVEFSSREASEMAISYEKGNLDNPLKLEWLSETSKKNNENPKTSTSSTIKDADYESLVLRQLRQAEERKRLIEQMMKEDNE